MDSAGVYFVFGPGNPYKTSPNLGHSRLVSLYLRTPTVISLMTPALPSRRSSHLLKTSLPYTTFFRSPPSITFPNQVISSTHDLQALPSPTRSSHLLMTSKHYLQQVILPTLNLQALLPQARSSCHILSILPKQVISSTHDLQVISSTHDLQALPSPTRSSCPLMTSKHYLPQPALRSPILFRRRNEAPATGEPPHTPPHRSPNRPLGPRKDDSQPQFAPPKFKNEFMLTPIVPKQSPPRSRMEFHLTPMTPMKFARCQDYEFHAYPNDPKRSRSRSRMHSLLIPIDPKSRPMLTPMTPRIAPSVKNGIHVDPQMTPRVAPPPLFKNEFMLTHDPQEVALVKNEFIVTDPKKSLEEFIDPKKSPSVKKEFFV
nr:proline-rich protein 36-like [Penaeus vannamei]